MVENQKLVTVRTTAALPTKRRIPTEAADERLTRTIADALPAGIRPISEIGFSTALEALAENSKIAISSDLECYGEWCRENHHKPLPSDPETLVLYLRALEDRGHRPATLSRRISSLGTIHRLVGLSPDSPPTDAPMVRSALKGVRRRKGSRQKQAAPLRLGRNSDVNGFTLSALLDACGGDSQGLRDAALLSLGYDAGLRVSELVRVEECHIDVQNDGSATLFIPFSKTDQEQEGAWAWLSAETVRRTRIWLDASGISDGPIFRRVGIDRRRAASVDDLDHIIYTVGKTSLTRQGVNGIYRRVAMAAFEKGLVEISATKVSGAIRNLSSHSLRVGLTQDLFAAGEDGAGIAQALRWSSPSTALRYGRKLAVKNNVAARVLSTLRK